ncbi:anthocyanidin reductase ((2S)-flavan-3-ol-forming) [Phoenix dactylifera]|uniref:Anthocyanidin reductase ((2S)-flavan-3-ol-forming) n=1 Tax=Phoenix dactylifera TaxID=42345 RepID=A0A8B7BJG3_PHODC|nr:anthocyanidin reductase ((2S)-flavan-3-ol-forming) [Phoenix dactylifera]
MTQGKLACVTGGTGFMASVLIKQLLEKGYAVNTTVRDPEKSEKLSHLKEMQNLGSLKVFRADLGVEGSFDEAVAGCDYVFSVAAPVNLNTDDPENELIKPAVQGILNVMKSCLKAKSVKRFVLTSSAASVSFRKSKENGLVLDEESWSDMEYLTTVKPPTWGYGVSKMLAEREASRFAQENNINLLTIVPALSIGPAPVARAAASIDMALSLLTGNEMMIHGLKIMQSISGFIAIGHIEDVCRAHIFVAENESASGRYICCSINTTLPELASFLSKRYPRYKVPTDFGELPEKAELSLSSEKLMKAGFEFKYKQLEEIYDETVKYAKATGLLPSK